MAAFFILYKLYIEQTDNLCYNFFICNKIYSKDQATMKKDKIKRFDFAKKPHSPAPWLMWVAKTFVAWPYLKRRGAVLRKHNMESLEGNPYLLLCNHASLVDLCLMLKATHPYPVNNVMTLEGFNTYTEPIMRTLGVLGKRKYVSDISLVRNIRYCLHELKNIMVIFPEARYSLDGCTSFLTDSTGGLIRMLRVPVAVLKIRGNFVDLPQWNKHSKKCFVEADVMPLFTEEEAKTLSVDELNARIREAFQYDDFAWQKNNGIVIDHPERADGLHALLYKCPACLAEGETDSKGDTLFCRKCGKKWFMETDGSLRALEGKTEFSHIPDWSNWERECVRKEIEDGTYYFEDEIRLETLPNAWCFYKHGKGKLVQTTEGTTITGTCYDEPFELHKSAMNLSSMHIEYDYRGRGDCVDISTLEDSYWCYLTKRDAITKLSFATEEIFLAAQKKTAKAKKEETV